MFEPSFDDDDRANVIISVPETLSEGGEQSIPLEQLSANRIAEIAFDLLLVGAAKPDQAPRILEACCLHQRDVALVGNPANDASVVCNVIRNIKGKLDSNALPNNIDVADIREFVRCSDDLFAFNNHLALFDFLATAQLGDHVAALYLAHRNTDVDSYARITKEIATHLTDSAYFTSSFYYEGLGECTALIGVRRFN